MEQACYSGGERMEENSVRRKTDWSEKEDEKLISILYNVVHQASHAAPKDLAYWISHHHFNGKYPVALIQKQMERLKRVTITK
jgi:hypothetical protein